MGAQLQVSGLVSIKRTQELLGGISRMQIYRCIHAGLLKPLKLGTRTVFEAADVERCIALVREGSFPKISERAQR